MMKLSDYVTGYKGVREALGNKDVQSVWATESLGAQAILWALLLEILLGFWLEILPSATGGDCKSSSSPAH